MKNVVEVYFQIEEDFQDCYFQEVEVSTEKFEEVYFKIETETE